MDHKRAIEVLVEIERRAEVNSLRAGGVRLWPLVRLGLWEQLLKPGDPPAAPGRAPLRCPPWSALMRWRARRRLRALPRAEALFLSRHEDYGDRVPAGHCNRHVDPVLAFCQRRLTCLKLEAREPAAGRTLPRAVATEFFQPDRLAELPAPPALDGIESLRATLREIDAPLRLDEPALQREAAQLLRRRAAYREVLATVRPRVVFLVCYYDRRVLPLVAAARDCGIPTVDIQHGKQGVYHGLYSHWTRIPPDGYELLPDVFWVWGEPSRRHIADSRGTESPHHRPIVGGNRWLAQWRRGVPFPQAPDDDAWLADVRKAERVILVTLQPIEPALPPTLREAMKRSPADWLWLLRAHPQRRAEVPALVAELSREGAASFEGERASTMPLYGLLRIADRHITCWSSVAHEAPAFDVPTLIVHPSGRQLYAEEIDTGRFQYAEHAETVLAWVAGEKPCLPPGEAYIETDDARAEAALDAIRGEDVREMRAAFLQRSQL